MPNEIPVILSFYPKRIGKRAWGTIWKTTEKYKIFPVAIDKEVTERDQDGNESAVAVSYKIKLSFL